MKKKLVLALICILSLTASGLIACGGANESDVKDEKIYAVYTLYAATTNENGETPLSYEEWLASVKGADGNDGINGVDGKDGVSIIKIEKTSADNLTDTYTITFSDDSTFIFTVTNGKDGEKGEKGEQGEKGENGTNGENGVGIDGITPQLRINEDTNFWEVSYDNGVTWTSLNIKATGDKGAGIKKAEINVNGELIITLTDDSTVNAGAIKKVHPHEIVEKEIIDKEPTCHSAGISYIICDTCKEILRTVAIEKTPHIFADEIVAPTCTESGYTTHTCTVCGYKTTDSIVVPKGHSYKQDYMFNDVYHWQETICGHKDAIVNELHMLDDNGICTICGYDSNITLALKYVEINDGKEYAVDELDSDQVKAVYIPETYNNKPVTKINEMVFYGNTTIEKVIMGDNITDIGVNAFYGCSNLQTVKLSERVAEINNNAFYGCNSLTSVTIPDSVTSIGGSAFYGCNSLTSVTIPDSVTSIGGSAFYNCSKLTSITIPDSVTSIGSSAFYGCRITSVTIGNSVTSIGSSAFYGCRITSVTIPDSVTSIGREAFYGSSCVQTSKGVSYVDKWLIKCANAVTAVTIKGDTAGIADYAFNTCSSLTSVTLPDSVTSIGHYAFQKCSSLEVVTIGNSVTSIGSFAFNECKNLTSVTIGNSVTSIGEYAFYDCSSLTSIIIPDSVTSIGEYAFYDCSSLTSIIIPDSVTSIGRYAFGYCDGLEVVTIGNSVTDIAYQAFYNCRNLTIVYYTGTAKDWAKISIGSANDSLKNATRYYYSETEPELNGYGTAYNGNYWHYVDGEIVVWTKEN